MKNSNKIILVILLVVFVTIVSYRFYTLSLENTRYKNTIEYYHALSKTIELRKMSKYHGINQDYIFKNKTKNKSKYFNYQTRLEKIDAPKSILNDYPEFITPIDEENRFLAKPLITDKDADIIIRAWRYSYNARGIIEMENRIRGKETILIVVHPWGIDDGRGPKTPEPAGAVLFFTPKKNKIYLKHTVKVLKPFITKMREHLSFISFSLPGIEDPIRRRLYRSPINNASPTWVGRCYHLTLRPSQGIKIKVIKRL